MSDADSLRFSGNNSRKTTGYKRKKRENCLKPELEGQSVQTIFFVWLKSN